ncbi:MAG: SH3 domain-containing protein [Chitinophagaceae bacterium]|nr:SH3 domain-containing protein [Anaerolineae bacterium]
MKRHLFAVMLTLFVVLMPLAIQAKSVHAQAITNAYGIVTAFRLNVRDYPDPTYGAVIARISRNEFYLVTAKSALNNWWQIQLADGRFGWVNGGYFTVYDGYLAPVITPAPVVSNPSPQPIPAPTGALGTVATGSLNVRTAPNPVNGVILARVYAGEVYAVVGRTASMSWWQIRLVDGRVGWVSDRYLDVTNYGSVPVTG